MCDTPDFADGGWQATGIADSRPGPIGAVTVEVTQERLGEEYDVTFILDPASAESGYRVRAAYTEHEDPGEGETLHADLDSVDFLRISGYGIWAQHGLAAALRPAADLLDATETG